MSTPPDPTVSVLVPVRDDEDYIKPAIDSILSQTYADFELVLIEAGSVDSTPEIIASYDDPRIRVETVSDKASLYEALNYGLRVCRGHYIARHDADGLSVPTRIEKQVRYLNENPAVVAIGTSAHLLTPGGARTETISLTPRVTIQTLRRQNELIHGSVMVRRDALDSIGGYDELFKIRGGYDLWLRLLSEGELHNFVAPLYNIRTYRTPVSSHVIRDLALYHYFALHQHGYGDIGSVEQLEQDRSLETFLDSLPKSTRASFHVDVAQTMLRYGKRSDARRELITALHHSASHKAVVLLLMSFGGPLVDKFVPADFQKYRFRELDRKKWQ